MLFGLTAAQTYFAAEGENVTVQCRFHAGGKRKIFCKNDCGQREDVLLETSADRARSGRYSMEYSRRSDARVMDVSIESVTGADSGEYHCVMDRVVATARRKITINVTASHSRPSNSTTSSEQNLYFLLLLLVIPAVLIIVTVIYKKKKRREGGEQTRNTKGVVENIYGPASDRAESTYYQSLSPDTRDQNQIYCSLYPHRPPHIDHCCNC